MNDVKEEFKGSSFAGAVGPDEADNFALHNAEVDIFDSDAIAVSFCEVIGFDYCFNHVWRQKRDFIYLYHKRG
jgi:hypothetical protein